MNQQSSNHINTRQIQSTHHISRPPNPRLYSPRHIPISQSFNMVFGSHMRKSLSSASVSSTPARSTPISQSTPVSTRTSLSVSPPPSGFEAQSVVATDAKIAQVVAHFEDPDLLIPVNESEASTDRGYLGGWIGGYGGGAGKKEGLSENERFWLSKGCIIK
jgi:hypothetical protein